MKLLEGMKEAIKCMKAHKEAFEEWQEGAITDFWRDEHEFYALSMKVANGGITGLLKVVLWNGGRKERLHEQTNVKR